MQGALSLGPSENAQGGHKFYTLQHGTVVVRRKWMELPTPTSVIERVHLLARGMPALAVWTDCAGCVIGNAIDEDIYNHDDNPEPVLHPDGINIPGVHMEET